MVTPWDRDSWTVWRTPSLWPVTAAAAATRTRPGAAPICPTRRRTRVSVAAGPNPAPVTSATACARACSSRSSNPRTAAHSFAMSTYGTPAARQASITGPACRANGPIVDRTTPMPAIASPSDAASLASTVRTSVVAPSAARARATSSSGPRRRPASRTDRPRAASSAAISRPLFPAAPSNSTSLATPIPDAVVTAHLSTVQQPLGGGRVVGGQYDQARLLLAQGENLARALREPPSAADAGDLATLEDVGPVGEVPDEQQRRPPGPADQQRHRARRVTGSRQQG